MAAISSWDNWSSPSLSLFWKARSTIASAAGLEGGVSSLGPSAALGEGSPTIPGPGITIEFATSTIGCDDRAFPFAPLSTVAQELVVAGGAEAVASRSPAG